MITLYGIPNCDTVTKARKWLTARDIEFQFHNFKKHGLDKETLENWVKQLGWEVLLNKRGMTWRKFSDEQKADINETKAIYIMLENTSIIKRPVMDMDGQLYVGFKPELYDEIFNLNKE